MITTKVRYAALSVLMSVALVWPAMAQQEKPGTNQPQTPSGSNQASPEETQFLKDAAMDNMSEIQLAQMAQNKTQNDQVRQYAQMLVTDHQNAQKEIRKLAQQYGVNLPGQLDQKHQDEMDRMSNVSGNQFDQQFVELAVTDHQRAVDMFQKAAQNAQSQDIRKFASDTVVIMQKHLDRAQTLKQQMNRTSAIPTPEEDRKGENAGR